MAKETKSLTCAPESESDLIEIWQTFGWELFSTQEVRDTESHLEQGFGDTINSVTTTTHYIKLTFQRDPANVPHYAELKALENEFNSVPYPGDCPTGYSVLKIFIGFMLCTIPGVYMLVKTILAASARPKWKQDYAEYLAKRQEIYSRAQAVACS
ncbi:MAG: hypothetical protein ACLR23_26560 [Clostridia bacterium]|uniref:Uncharacterized protein n=1 Tax=Bianquea renquensis TaxID=2763661 RepID=A0A926DVY4_9FIRM|nr:hypothetical protein [Bianquea renquensis]MBC8544245.1 hypothetical protein [Bianquea renquensis]